jgi:hypothetical protein
VLLLAPRQGFTGRDVQRGSRGSSNYLRDGTLDLFAVTLEVAAIVLGTRRRARRMVPRLPRVAATEVLRDS